jgi:signal transduction histidine kinase
MTIRLQLTLFWAAMLALILFGAGSAVLWLFQHGQWEQLNGALREEADTATAGISHAGGAGAERIVQRLSEERDLGPARRVQLVVGGRRGADAGARWADLPSLANIPGDGAIRNGRNDVFHYALVPLTVDGVSGWLIDGVDATPIRTSIARLRRNLILILPLILVACSSAGYWLAGRALAPVNVLYTALAALEPRDLHRRLPLAKVNDEMARLTRAINALLGRVEAASETERRFAADAAHELRTPLAILRTGLEVAISRERPGSEYADALAAALSETIALCEIGDELLAFSRLEHEAVDRGQCDFGRLICDVVETLEPLVAARAIHLRMTLGEAVFVEGNREHLRRLVVNLLDNAIKFTSAHGAIMLNLAADGGRRTTLRIVNDGPPIPSVDLPHIFDRFFRGRAQEHPGNGLGLSFCHEIARLHGGSITAANLDDRGVEFVVTLPGTGAQPETQPR